MKLPKLLFGASHPTYHFMMFVIASACLGLLLLIARKVGAI